MKYLGKETLIHDWNQDADILMKTYASFRRNFFYKNEECVHFCEENHKLSVLKQTKNFDWGEVPIEESTGSLI
jgi:hypothetical protein